MKRYISFVCLVAILFASCKKDIDHVSPIKDITAFKFEVNNAKLIANEIVCDISDTLITGFTEENIDKKALIATYLSTGGVVTVNGVVQTSGVTKNDFSNPVTYKVKAEDGSERSYTVKLTSFTGLPIIYLRTDGPVHSKEIYVNGHMIIDGNTQYAQDTAGFDLQIRGRGHTTWELPKKPYKLKLASKAGLLGMPADKEWALLANYLDKSLIRNRAVFELGQRIQDDWTPRSRFVELFLNGEYEGNYLLTETIKVSDDRLDLKETKDTSTAFLLEVDYRHDGDQWYTTSWGLNWVVQSEKMTLSQFNFAKQYTENIEKRLYDYNTRENYQTDLNSASFVDWFIINELSKNTDTFFSSTYFFKANNNRFSIGPLWDYDLALANVKGYEDPEGWQIMGGAWYNQLLQTESFKKLVKDRWNKIKSEKLFTIGSYIQDQANYLKYSQVQNFKRWNILKENIYNSPSVPGTFQGEIDITKQFIEKRLAWLDGQINLW